MRIGRERLRDTEVRHHHPATGALEQDVVGLHVAVDHALLVGGGERIGRFARDATRLVHGQPAASLDPERERLAVHQPHDEIDQVARFADDMDGNDVRMRQPRRRLRFAQEPGTDVGPECQVGRQHLDRDRALQLDVASLVDYSHAATADLALDSVRPGERLGQAGFERGHERRGRVMDAIDLASGRCGGNTTTRGLPGASGWLRSRDPGVTVSVPIGFCCHNGAETRANAGTRGARGGTENRHPTLRKASAAWLNV